MAPDPHPESRLRSVNVLVVDDDPPTLGIVREILRAMGIGHIATAADGREALEIIADRIKIDPDLPPFELIVCDWRMPEMSGLDLLKMVRRKFPKLPFVMLTALHSADEVRAAAEAGVTAYIMKPIVPAEVKKKVAAVLAETRTD